MPDPSVARRVRKHRDALRTAGPRPVQTQVPDTIAPGFPEECRRQTALTAAADRADPALMSFVDAAGEDVGDWE